MKRGGLSKCKNKEVMYEIAEASIIAAEGEFPSHGCPGLEVHPEYPSLAKEHVLISIFSTR